MSTASGSKYIAPREVWEKKIAEHMKSVDPKWIAVDNFTSRHLCHETEAAAAASERSDDAGVPPIACTGIQAKLMGLMCYGSSVTHALEIGTLGGLTAIRLAQSDPQLHVTTIELHDIYAQIARQNIEAAGLQDRIEVLVGPAIDVLPRLAGEIEAGKRPRFGLGFVDADEENNLAYVDWIVKISLPRGFIFLDNVDIRALDFPAVDKDGTSMHSDSSSVTLVEAVGRDPRLEAVVLQTVGQKGRRAFMMCAITE